MRIGLAPLVLVLLPLAALGACSSEKSSPNAGGDAGIDAPVSICPTGYLGDPNKAIVIELRALLADGTDVPLDDGNDLALLAPPQGGRVSFVGVRATNLDGCAVQVTGALRDPVTKQVRLDGRTVNLRREVDDAGVSWGTTGKGTSANIEDSADLGDYSNVPICPNQWANQDIFDQTYELDVIVTDRLHKTTTKTINVVPRCAEPGAKEVACRCLCKNGYVLGEVCGDATRNGDEP